MKRVGILCVGNDSPGTNAAVCSAVVKRLDLNIEAMGIKDGFEGLLNNNLDVLLRPNVSNILHQGGTILGTSLFVPEDKDLKTIKKKIEQYGISSLIILGGRIATKAVSNAEVHHRVMIVELWVSLADGLQQLVV